MDNDLSRKIDECNRNLSVAESLESIAESYDFESFESVDFETMGFLINTIVTSNGFQLDSLSLEESASPASDEATGKVTSKTDKIKQTLKDTANKFIDKAKDIAKDIPGYLERLQAVLTNSTSALKNSVIKVENKLQNGELVTGQIEGKYSVFDKQKPNATIDIVIKSTNDLAANIDKIFNDYVKKSKGDKVDTNIKLSLKDHTGAEYKCDGTTKFFKPNMSFETKSIGALSKTDIDSTLSGVTKLVAGLDNISAIAKKMSSTNFDSLVSNVKDSDGTVKASVKEVMSISSFNRNVIGGYVKYAIKVAQASLDACNKSIKTKEGIKDE